MSRLLICHTKWRPPICYCLMLCVPHPPTSYLVLIGHLFNDSCLVSSVLLRSLAKPADGHLVLLTEELEFLSMLCTDIHLLLLPWAGLELLEPLHYVGHMPIRPQIPKQVTHSAHGADELTRFVFAGLIVQCDAGSAEAVTTICTHGLHHEVQTDRTGHLLLDHPQDWWGHCCCDAESVYLLRYLCDWDDEKGDKWERETQHWTVKRSMNALDDKGKEQRREIRREVQRHRKGACCHPFKFSAIFHPKWLISEIGLLFPFIEDQEDRVSFHQPRVTDLLSLPFFPRTKSHLQCYKHQTAQVSPTVLPPSSAPVSGSLWSSPYQSLTREPGDDLECTQSWYA